ncbi:MAG TPA: phosphatidylinositol mannoside acyltransferase [Streptosporangiaceae bacterium]|nr:phosphatidylinositol mannoside acyltransferase [Streptosporangiaceae bacterium]
MKDRVMDLAYAFGWTAVRKLPESFSRTVFDRIADRVWRKRGKGVLQLEKNLSRVVPGLSEPELRQLSRKGMRSYLRYWLEAFRLPEMSRERVLQVVAEGEDEIFKNLEAGRGVICALPHTGNYDHAGAWITYLGAPFTTVMERLKPESLYERFVAYRESLGMEILPLTGSAVSVMGTLARRLREGRLVCLVADRDLSATGIEVDFFGRPARMPGGSAALAVQTGAALLPATLWYEGERWGIRIHEEVPVPEDGTRKEKIAAMTQSLANAFAEGIAAHPEDWHMMQRVWVEDL